MVRALIRVCAVLGVLAIAAAAGAKDLGGVIVAAPGASTVVGTYVLLCPWSEQTQSANCEAYRPLEIRVGNVIGTFRFTGVAEAGYRILAYRDINRTGDLDAGDEAALFSEYPHQDGTNVRPGRLDVALRLIPYGGDPSELLPARRADRQTFDGVIAVSPSALVGRWGGTGPIADNYNAVTGQFAGTTWSARGIEFRANGTYESADLFQQTSGCTVYVDKGSYRAMGNTIRLTPTRLEQFVCGRGNTTRTRSGNSSATDFAWRFYYYAGSGLKFEMIERTKLRDERDWYYARDYAVGAR